VGKLMKLRRDDVCVACETPLVSGTNAYWFASERLVRCIECWAGSATVDVAPPVDAPPAAVTNAAGGSAQSEYDKRSARELATKHQLVGEDVEWRQAIKQQRPVLGRVAAALTPKPQITPESQSTTAWKIGAEGERRVAEVLDQAMGIEVLHDRLVPGSRANIDHIAIGPSGVFVIDAKKYTGRIEVRDIGGLFRTDERLYVNSRDRTKVVDGVLHQVDVVRTALGTAFSDVAVQGVLCFVGCEWGWIMRTKRIKGVTALWPQALPDHVSDTGSHAARVHDIADRLRANLRPAT
jgi:hypothetical protein